MDIKTQEVDKTQEGDRIAKYIARAGICSRREAERLIAEGRVEVNGLTLTSPAIKVSDRDDIRVDEERVGKSAGIQLWRFHKPADVVTTHRDPQGRKTVFDCLPPALTRVISIGRLDLTTEGLLLLTTDGALARALELPSTGWIRRYRVRAHGRVSQNRLDRLGDGIVYEGVRYGPIKARLDHIQGANSWMTISITEGRNREIRQICRALNLQVNRLIRTAYGPFQLGELKKNALKEVPLKALREQLGPALSGRLGLS